MAKQNLQTFIEKVNAKHKDNHFDFSKSTYKGMDKNITYICPVHGEVTQPAKKVLVHTGCPLCDEEKAKEKRRSGSYAKHKGNNYELKIAKELKDCGFMNVVTSRSESKHTDDNKIDLIDLDGKLPINIQCKCTKNTPNYFNISEACTDKSKPFVVFWNKQEVKEGQTNMSSKGEVVMVDKEFFYKLLKNFTK